MSTYRKSHLRNTTGNKRPRTIIVRGSKVKSPRRGK